jgi:hypothetical protein
VVSDLWTLNSEWYQGEKEKPIVRRNCGQATLQFLVYIIQKPLCRPAQNEEGIKKKKLYIKKHPARSKRHAL